MEILMGVFPCWLCSLPFMQGLGRVLRAYVGDLTKRDWFNGDGGVWEKSLQV